MKKILLSTLILFAVAAVSCEKKDMELRGDDIIKFNDPNFLKALLTYECAYTEEYQPISVDADNDGNISVNEASSHFLSPSFLTKNQSRMFQKSSISSH